MSDNARCEKHGCEKVWVKDSSRKAGGQLRCPECKRESDRRWHAANPEKGRDNSRRWARENREKSREKTRQWQKANPEWHREKTRQWHDANPEKVRENKRRWQKANPEKNRAKSAVGRAVKKGDLRYTGNCWLCDEPADRTDFHHAWGYDRENWLRVVEVCKPCHGELNQVTPDEFMLAWKQVIKEMS